MPFTVNIESIDGLENIERQYKYGELSTFVSDTFFTFNNFGIYDIIQLRSLDVYPKTDTLTVEAVAAVSPIFEITKCEGTQISISLNDQNFEDYLVSFGTEASTILSSNQSIYYTFKETVDPFVIVHGLLNDKSEKCGESRQDFLMGGPPSKIQKIDYEIICTDLINLHFEFDFDALQLYEVEGLSFVYHSGKLDSSKYVINDFSVDDQIEYCFRLNKIFECSDDVKYGEYQCLSINYDLNNSFRNKSFATYDSTEFIRVGFDPISKWTYSLERIVEGFDPDPIGNVNSGYLDQNISSLRKYDYILYSQDNCGNQPISTIISPPDMKFIKTAVNNYDLYFSEPQNNLEGFQNKYLLVNNKDTIIVESNPYNYLVDPSRGKIHNISLNYDYDEISIRSQKISVHYDEMLVFPMAFSPNNDGINDEFGPVQFNKEGYQINIYNRLGQTVFQTTYIHEMWDGTFDNKIVSEGKYFYRVIFVGMEKNIISQLGSFVLLR